MDWDQAANAWASGILTIACAVFCVVYHWRAPWYRSGTGRHIMAVGITLGLLGLYTVLITIWQDGPAAVALRIVRILVILAVAALMLQRVHMILRAQHHDPADHR